MTGEASSVRDGPSPQRILSVGLGFWASKTLLSAVELGVFTELAARPLDAEALRGRLELHPRSGRDFFDALVALGLLERERELYRNTPESDLFLDRAKPSYIGGLLEMANARLYPFWGSLTEALRTGEPQNEAKTGEDFFARLYEEPDRLAQFLQAMTGLSMGAAKAIAAKFPWDRYRAFADIGTAQGGVPVQIALAHPHLSGIGFDLPPLRPLFESYVARFELADRLTFQPGDFFADPLPETDVLIMGHVLHDWSEAQKRELLEKSHAVLRDGGALIVFDAVIDDDRRQNAFGLLMSLNMLIETPAGFDYTGADCQGWMRDAGFRETYVEPLVGPDSMIVGIK
jgi:hypothetical protein